VEPVARPWLWEEPVAVGHVAVPNITDGAPCAGVASRLRGAVVLHWRAALLLEGERFLAHQESSRHKCPAAATTRRRPRYTVGWGAWRHPGVARCHLVCCILDHTPCDGCGSGVGCHRQAGRCGYESR
jgi:hypothetical protein